MDEDSQGLNQSPNADLEQRFKQLEQRYAASSSEAQKLLQRAQNAERLLADYAESQRQAVPQRTPNNPYERLNEYGLPSDVFGEVIRTEVQNALQPLAQGFQARNQLLSEYPEYGKYEANVAQYVNSDPQVTARYNKLFTVDPAGAMEYAMLKFTESQRKSSGNGAGNSDAQVQRMASEAQIPSARSGDARNAPMQDQERLGKAWEHYQKTGRPDAYVKERLRQVIPDEFLNK